MQGITRGEGEMRLDQFEKLLRLLERRHFPHQPLRYILVFRFISGNLFFLQLHTAMPPVFQKNYPACAPPVTGVTGRILFSTNRAFRSGQGR